MLSRLLCTLPGGFARIRLLTGRLAKTLFSVVTAVGVLAAVAPAARADPGFDDGPPDKALHTWCYYDVGSLRSEMDAAMTRLRAETVVETAYYSTCGVHTDVRWVQGPTPFAGYVGWTECKLRYDNGNCDRFRITLYKAAMDATPGPELMYHETSCHELGHTVGVRHYPTAVTSPDSPNQSCMRNYGYSTGAPWEVRYGHHHKTVHINPWFS